MHTFIQQWCIKWIKSKCKEMYDVTKYFHNIKLNAVNLILSLKKRLLEY